MPDDGRRSHELGASYEGSRSDDQNEGRPADIRLRWVNTSYDFLVLTPISSYVLHPLTYSLLCCRADIVGATLGQSKPRFPPARYLRTLRPRLTLRNNHVFTIGSGIKALAHSSSISIDLANVLEDVTYLTSFVEEHRHGSPMIQDITHFDDQRASIEDRVLMMVGDAHELRGISKAQNVQEPCRLVALIYTNMVFRELQVGSAIHITLTRYLKIELMQINRMSCGTNLSEVLLWILFLGGAIAAEEPTRSWFVSAVALLCSQLKLWS